MNQRARHPGAKERNPDGLNAEGFRLVLGQQAVREVIRAWGGQTHRVVVQDGAGPRVQALARFATDQGIEVKSLGRPELDRISAGGQHQGVLAFAPPLRLHDFSEVLLNPDLLAVALDGVVDPHNFGAVVRSAVGVAGAPILWAESSSAPLSPTTFRASAGAIEHATLCRVRSLTSALMEAQNAGVEILGLAPEATEFLHEVRTRGPVVLVIGSEQKGMGRGVRKACTRLVRLHQTGTVQSLNASVAAGIALHCLATGRPKVVTKHPQAESDQSIE
jgi:23S rRNA (guanosine2251-2'-O)-methyltransferase